MRQLILDINPGVTPTLDNFVVGRNAETLEALHVFAAEAGSERFFYLWGDAGAGKTHLLRAITNAFTGGKAVYRNCEPGMGLGAVLGCDLLAIDNVQHLTDSAQITLFNAYNEIREANGRLLVSGDVPPAQLTLRDDLKTRLAWGLAYQIHALTDNEIVGALQRHAMERGLRLTPEVIDFLFHHQPRDLPSLLMSLDKLDRYSLETKRAVSVPLLKQALKLDDTAP